MRTKEYNGILTALSPIHHGSSDTGGTTRTILTIPQICYNNDGEKTIENIPTIHGNAIRGLLRRYIMQDFFERLEYKLSSKKIYHFFFTGGMLQEQSAKDAGAITIEYKKKIIDTLPPIALLGSALGNQMFTGKLKVSNADIICQETKHHINQKGVFEESNTLIGEDYGTRLDDLRGLVDQEDINKKTKKKEAGTSQQMIYEFEVLIRGTQFTHKFNLLDTNKIEESCYYMMMEIWKDRPYIGGKSGTGYGEVSLNYPDLENSCTKDYITYIENNKENIISVIKDMESKWK